MLMDGAWGTPGAMRVGSRVQMTRASYDRVHVHSSSVLALHIPVAAMEAAIITHNSTQLKIQSP